MSRKILVGPFISHRKGKKITVGRHLRPDKGAKGPTPKARRFLVMRPGIKLGAGYTKRPAGKRHGRLRALDRKKNISSANVYHELQGLANVTVGRKPQKVFKQDASWAMKNLMNKKERRALTAPARRARR